mgnify:CR=1 FL=1
MITKITRAGNRPHTLAFRLSGNRVLECWIHHMGIYDRISDLEVSLIEQVIAPNVEEYWNIAEPRAGYFPEVTTKCITIRNPSWRKQLARIK